MKEESFEILADPNHVKLHESRTKGNDIVNVSIAAIASLST